MSLKSWIAMQALNGNLPAWVYKYVGKKIGSKLDLQEGNVMETKKWYQSKALLSAITMIVVGAVQPISTALGHPVTVPQWIIDVLIGMGIYGIRTGDKPIA